MPKIPSSFFKFVKKDRIDILSNGVIRFTPPADFNDPFELNPAVTHYTRCWIDRLTSSNLADDQLQEEDYKFSTDRRCKIEHHRKMIAQHANEHGILSLSASYDANPNPAVILGHESDPRNNLLMWAHYADKHTGFSIEFSPDFIKAETYEINYTSSRPVFTFEEIEAGAHLIYLHKSKEWEYESEWRCIKRLVEADVKIVDGIHLFRFNKRAIKSITLGYNASKKTRDSIIKIQESDPEFKDTVIFFTELNESTFSLDFHQEIRSDGRCFSNASNFSPIQTGIQKRPK